MSHDSVISALNALSKTIVNEVDPTEHVRHLTRESDRSVIILCGSSLEHTLDYVLTKKMPDLNADERTRLFGFNGPLGTFSAKIAFAQGLGAIDRQMAKRLEVIRCMRNAAAHCVTPITFGTDEIKSATTQLASPQHRQALAKLPQQYLSAYFVHAQAVMAQTIIDRSKPYDEQVTIDFIGDLMRTTLEALRGKPAAE